MNCKHNGQTRFMMLGITVMIIFHAFLGQVSALAANDSGNIQDSMDRFFDTLLNKMIDKVQDGFKTLHLHHADLDGTALGKPAHYTTLGKPVHYTTLGKRDQYPIRGLSLPLTPPSPMIPRPSMALQRATANHARRFDFHVTRAASTDALPENLENIVALFEMVPDDKLRYQQLLAYAGKLPAMPDELKTTENKVVGCTSQVWLVPKLEGDVVTFVADSDSQLTKGLATVLVKGLSGSTVKQIVGVEPDFIERMGLKQSLTPSRSNGFLNMLTHAKKKSVEMYAATQNAVE